MDRRTFLGSLSGAAAAAIIARNSAWAAEPHQIKTIGIQLYTVREALKVDYDGTLAKLAEIGYREVESGKDHDKSDPKEMRDALKRHGLTSPSYHVDWNSLAADWPKVIEDNQIVGRTGRFCMVHVKDVHEVPDAASVRSSRFAGENMTILADVGTGIIDWKRIFAHSEQAGIKHYFVEHDNPKNGLETARVSYEYLEKLRF